MCKLVHKTTDKTITAGEHITDISGNPWMYFVCTAASGNDGKPEVLAHRMANGRPAKRASAFNLAFFPNYRISVCK